MYKIGKEKAHIKNKNAEAEKRRGEKKRKKQNKMKGKVKEPRKHKNRNLIKNGTKTLDKPMNPGTTTNEWNSNKEPKQ